MKYVMSELLILFFLFIGIFFTWFAETITSYIRIVLQKYNQNVISLSLVSAISVVSRFGFFIQTFIIAWIIDLQLFLNHRLELSIFFMCVVAFTNLFLFFYGSWFVKLIYKIYVFLGLINNNLNKFESNKITLNPKISPQVFHIFAYLFLYCGALVPLLAQLYDINLAARGIAIAGIVNGVATIMLLSIIDVKYANAIQNNKTSEIPEKLIKARFYALVIIIFIMLTFYSLNG